MLPQLLDEPRWEWLSSSATSARVGSRCVKSSVRLRRRHPDRLVRLLGEVDELPQVGKVEGGLVVWRVSVAMRSLTVPAAERLDDLGRRLALRNGERAELRLHAGCLRTNERQVGDGGGARREGL